MKMLKWMIIGGLSLFFLLAGGSKIPDPLAFGQAILRYQLVSHQLAWVAALWLPWIEVMSAVGLLLKNWRQAAIYLLLGLLVMFEGILISALVRGLDIECGCLGTNASGSLSFALVRNAVIIALLFLLMVFETSEGEGNPT